MIWFIHFLMGFGIGAVIAKGLIGYKRLKKK